MFNTNPPQIVISVADEHVAGDFIRAHGEFVLNIPTAEIVEQFDTVDMNSGDIGDKFAMSAI